MKNSHKKEYETFLYTTYLFTPTTFCHQDFGVHPNEVFFWPQG